MAVAVIVLIEDRDDPKHGEIAVLEDMRKAERLIETLLEAGFEQERVRVFTGSELDMRVTHRPVVALEQQGDSASADSSSADPEAEREDAPGEADTEEEQAPATAFVRDGVRFSSLFRNA